jgi:uncharacterized membrane protein (DUF485 family)
LKDEGNKEDSSPKPIYRLMPVLNSMHSRRRRLTLIILLAVLALFTAFPALRRITGAATATTTNPLRPIIDAVVFAIVLLVIGMAVYTYVMMRKETKEEAAEAEQQKILEEARERKVARQKAQEGPPTELGQFIIAAKAKGYSKQKIRFSLKIAGWPKDQVEKEFEKYFKEEPEYPPVG